MIDPEGKPVASQIDWNSPGISSPGSSIQPQSRMPNAWLWQRRP
jgi:hypothetical protein